MSFRQCLRPHSSRVLMNRDQPRWERCDVRVWKDMQQNHRHVVSAVSESLVVPLSGFSAPSLPTQLFLGQISDTAGGWVFNWAFQVGGARVAGGLGGWFNGARSCFHPDLSASTLQVSILWLKRKVWLVGLPQRCQVSPSSSAACDICTLWNTPSTFLL